MLEDEWDPTFPLGHFWKAREHFEEKVPHPHIAGATTKVRFPVIGNETRLNDRARFYEEVYSLMDQVGIDGNNGPYLYFILTRCVKNQSLADWKQIMSERAGMPDVEDRELNREHFSDDVDQFITYHDSRDFEDLLNNQRTYMQKISKPANMSPTDFKNGLVNINTLIASLPEADEQSSFSNQYLKTMVFNAMPRQWRKSFREVGRRVTTETLDSLASFFDIYHKDNRPYESHYNDNNGQNHYNERNCHSCHCGNGHYNEYMQ